MRIDFVTNWFGENWPNGNWPRGDWSGENWSRGTDSFVSDLEVCVSTAWLHVVLLLSYWGLRDAVLVQGAEWGEVQCWHSSPCMYFNNVPHTGKLVAVLVVSLHLLYMWTHNVFVCRPQLLVTVCTYFIIILRSITWVIILKWSILCVQIWTVMGMGLCVLATDHAIGYHLIFLQCRSPLAHAYCRVSSGNFHKGG